MHGLPRSCLAAGEAFAKNPRGTLDALVKRWKGDDVALMRIDNMKRRLVTAGLLAISAATTASAAGKPREFDLWLTAGITIDKDGQLTQLTWKDQRAGINLVTDRITPAIHRWVFVPGSVDGQPAETTSGLVVGLHATENADGSVALRFIRATTGPSLVPAKEPEYPRSAMMDSVSAEVMMSMTVHPDGTSTVQDIQFVGSNGSRDQKQFLEVVGKWAAAQTFEPEKVAGNAVQTHVRIPVEFCVDWSSWCSQRRASPASDTLPRNQPAAIDSAVAIKTDVRSSKI